MRLKRIILFLFVCTSISINYVSAQPNYAAVDVMKQFSQILTEYSQTKDIGVCGPKFDNLCHESIKCRVENDLMKRIIDQFGDYAETHGTWLYDTYINEITQMMNNGCHISIENIEYESSMSKLGLVDGKADFIKYDIIVKEKLETKNRYTDLAIIRDGKITAIYQYAGARNYTAALNLLLPSYFTSFDKLYTYRWELRESDAEIAFHQFREIASQNYGIISKESMAMVVAMEIAGLGCKKLGNYAKQIDLANFFVRYNSCPKIYKEGSVYYLYGYRHINYYKEKGQAISQLDLYKGHPYMNDKGSAYFHYILPTYRSMASYNFPYINKKHGKYGFVSSTGETIIDHKYSFAYPFDPNSKLSAVRDENNKWGFISLTGRLAIPFQYDVVNDVFVDGKNFAIKDNWLVLINERGEELRKIYGYNYLIPKLSGDEIIAYNGISQQYDVYDFYGNLLMQDCFYFVATHKDKRKLPVISDKKYERYRYYYHFLWNDFLYNRIDDVHNFFLIPRIPKKISYSEISSGESIDLGFGTLWASNNLGAKSPSDMGELYLWGDYQSKYVNVKRTRSKGTRHEKQLIKTGIPSNIAGTYLDVATQTLGKDWRLPTSEELKKLTEDCIWEYCVLNSSTGYRIIGKNGNSIFLPIEGEFKFEPYDIQCKYGGTYVLYWSSESGYQEPYGLQISQYNYWMRYGMELCYWNYIRPVKINSSLSNK